MTREQRDAVDASALAIMSFGEERRFEVMCLVAESYRVTLVRGWPELTPEQVKGNCVNFLAAVNRRIREIDLTSDGAVGSA